MPARAVVELWDEGIGFTKAGLAGLDLDESVCVPGLEDQSAALEQPPHARH